jgi:hypothetical protein
MSDLAIDFRNPVLIKKLGIDALTQQLTPVGMAYFLRQFESGVGNYTNEKEDETKDLTYEMYKNFKDSVS